VVHEKANGRSRNYKVSNHTKTRWVKIKKVENHLGFFG
jgi:hypothetical protein